MWSDLLETSFFSKILGKKSVGYFKYSEIKFLLAFDLKNFNNASEEHMDNTEFLMLDKMSCAKKSV